MNRDIFLASMVLGMTVFFILSPFSSTFAQNDNLDPKLLTGVAKEYDKNNVGFEIEYYLKEELSNEVNVDTASNSISFEYDSKGISEDELIIILPMELIEPPITVFVNGEKESESIRFKMGNKTQMIIPLYADSKEITLVGAKVIPEFGSIAMLVLVLSIISIIVLTSKKNLQLSL